MANRSGVLTRDVCGSYPAMVDWYESTSTTIAAGSRVQILEISKSHRCLIQHSGAYASVPIADLTDLIGVESIGEGTE